MLRYATALILSAALVSTGYAAEAGKSKSRTALFVSNVFNESNVAFGALGLPEGPTYHAGIFLSDDMLAYGTLRLINHEEGTNYGFGGGARMYTPRSAPLRTFFDGSLDYVVLSDIAGPTGTVGGGASDVSVITLGGFFGAEYLFNKSASVALKVGATYSDYGKDADFSTLDIGVSKVMFNFYF